ncbi:MAG TPA: wax ester/triacylglycerol synthase family O-acyltransferase [Actinomycetota bacterium]|nr:wax ester/triacylglycerol synthase family O-acyltransferase [Actinomycetota bacterium]
MHRLSGADAGFLYLELPSQPMHSVSLLLLQPEAADSPPVTLDDIRRHLLAALPAVPCLRWRLKNVPLGLHHPVVYVDPEFDIDRHLVTITLLPPGDPEELDACVASLAETCLDRSKPLWQVTLIEGLEDGRQALAVQMHHCLMDGAALLAAFGLVCSGEPAPGGALEPADREPGAVRLVAGAFAHNLMGLIRLPGLLARSVRGARAVNARKRASMVPVPAPVADSPVSSVNAGSGPGRHLARTTLPLPDIRLVKETAGVTVNDVAIALCGGALRSYLEAKGDLPSRPLVAGVPVGIDLPGAGPRTSGNQWAILATTTGTEIADPWQRLECVASVTAEAKTQLALFGRSLLQEWLEYFPAWMSITAVRQQQIKLARRPEKVGCNVTVSNLRGPTQAWCLGPAVVDEFYVTGPPSNRLGVVFVLIDEGEHLAFSILSVAGSVDDPETLAAGLHGALRDLVKAAEARAA